LHDEQSLLPSSNRPGQQDQEHAIGVCACGPFHMAHEDDELLS
jgi:hypothetical protein